MRTLQSTPYTIDNDDRVWFYQRDATRAARHQARRDGVTVAIYSHRGPVRWVNAKGQLVDASGNVRGY